MRFVVTKRFSTRSAVGAPCASGAAIDAVCEGVLLSAGHLDESYARYALTATRATTHAAWFRAIAKKYPHKPAPTILADLVRLTPGEEGKWFAAAKEARLFDEAIALARHRLAIRGP